MGPLILSRLESINIIGVWLPLCGRMRGEGFYALLWQKPDFTMTTRRDFLKAIAALTASAAANSFGAPLADSFRTLPPLPVDVAEFMGVVPGLRGNAKNVVVTYPDRETRFSIVGDKIKLTTTFHDKQNNQDIVTSHTLPFGADFPFEPLRAAHEAALLAMPHGQFAKLTTEDRFRLSIAMTYAAIDDSYHAYAALDRSGVEYKRGKLLDGPPAPPSDTLSKHFGGGRPDYATMQIPHQGVTAIDQGKQRGIATVASPDRITTVRYHRDEMTVATGFIDRINEKYPRLAIVMQRGRLYDFDELFTYHKARLGAAYDKDIVAAMVFAQLQDIGKATKAQLSISNNSNAANLRLPTTPYNLPENEAILLETLRTRFGTLSATRPVATRTPSPTRSMTP